MPTVKVPVDNSRVMLVSTGKVHAVPVWREGRMVEGAQDMDPVSGLPLWSIDAVIDDGDENARSEAVGVRVAAPSAPVVQRWLPVQFEGLQVAIRTNKAGGLTAYWSATGVATATPVRRGGGDA